MRSIIRIITAFALLLSLSATTFAKAPRLSSKEREKIEKENLKEAKKLAKQYKKEGWKFEQAGLPENLICKFLNDEQINGLEQLVGTADNSASRSKARSYIKTKVANEYAQDQSGVFKGKLNGMESGDEEDAEEKFVKQWEARYAMEIAGMLKIGYSLYRKNDDGSFDMEIHYLVDPSACQQAKIAAAKQAIEIQKINQEWAQNISDALADIEED